MSTSHSRYLSGRSLGGLDRAAALPGVRRHGKRGSSLQESRLDEVVSVEAFWAHFRICCCAKDSVHPSLALGAGVLCVTLRT